MLKDISPIYPLKPNRAHEVCGQAAYSFAFALGAQGNGPILWVREKWRADTINPSGFAGFLGPERVILVLTQDQNEALAGAEDALRSGATPLVVMELSKPVGLTAGRRLQLAAEAGQSTALAVIPMDMGSNAAETRWRCEPVFDGEESTLQRWELIKNKSGTLGAWNVRWDQSARRIFVVSKAGQ